MMTSQILPGATVEYLGVPVTSVERALNDHGSGQLVAVLVRGGRADYLLRIPSDYLIVESPSRLQLNPDCELDDMEQIAVESGRTPPVGEHFAYAGQTVPTSVPMEILGQEPGIPSWYEWPATS
jgi:hypothetical protein